MCLSYCGRHSVRAPVGRASIRTDSVDRALLGRSGGLLACMTVLLHASCRRLSPGLCVLRVYSMPVFLVCVFLPCLIVGVGVCACMSTHLVVATPVPSNVTPQGDINPLPLAFHNSCGSGIPAGCTPLLAPLREPTRRGIRRRAVSRLHGTP